MSFKSSATAVTRLDTDEQSARRIADRLAESFDADDAAVAAFDAGAGRWRVSIHFRAAPNEKAVRALIAEAAGPAAAKTLRFERIAAKDWVRESLAGLAPVTAGRFVVHGAHDRARIAVNRIGIEIEAALAFGTGHHGTTRGCLLALDRFCKIQQRRRPTVNRHPEVRAKRASKGDGPSRHPSRRAKGAHLRMTDKKSTRRILDLGTGSGVLAIAAARIWRRRVLATDIDAGAVRVARANARLNRAGPWVEAVPADGVAGRSVRTGAPYDLIFANILLRPLQRFAAPLMRLIAPGGHIVLSGLLTAQAAAAIAAYRGLALERRITLDGWTTLVLTRRAGSRRDVAGCRPAP